jgi:hypothetical protein
MTRRRCLDCGDGPAAATAATSRRHDPGGLPLPGLRPDLSLRAVRVPPVSPGERRAGLRQRAARPLGPAAGPAA